MNILVWSLTLITAIYAVLIVLNLANEGQVSHIFDNLEKWINKVVYISNGICDEKQNIEDFNKGDNLFESVKDVISLDYDKNKEDGISINPLKYGPQFGYGNGRSSLVDK